MDFGISRNLAQNIYAKSFIIAVFYYKKYFHVFFFSDHNHMPQIPDTVVIQNKSYIPVSNFQPGKITGYVKCDSRRRRRQQQNIEIPVPLDTRRNTRAKLPLLSRSTLRAPLRWQKLQDFTPINCFYFTLV